MSQFAWSPVTVERLLILRAQGHKLSSIAAELGTTSSAIEHKLRRLEARNLPKLLKPLLRVALSLSRCLIFAHVTAAGLYRGVAQRRCFAESRGWVARLTASSTRSGPGRGWK